MSEHGAGPAQEHEALIRVRDLDVRFPRLDGTALRALNGVSIDVRAGECVGIVGESGCGKSTLARALIGLIPPPGQIAGGTISVCGVDVLSASSRKIRALRGGRAAMVFQDPLTALNPVMTIGAQIRESLKVHERLSRRASDHRVIELLAKVGIPDPASRARAYPHQLSGGMRQRAVIAIAISCNPEVLIADEPTTALDVTVQAQILELLDDLRTTLEMAIVLVSHDLGVVAGLADRVAVIYAGTIVEQGRAVDVLAAPAHPYTRGLLSSRMEIDDARPDRLLAIPGSAPSLYGQLAECPFRPRCSQVVARCREEVPVLASAQGRQSAACWVTAPPAAVAAQIGMAP